MAGTTRSRAWLALAVGLVAVVSGCSGGPSDRGPAAPSSTAAPSTRAGGEGSSVTDARCPLGPLPAPAANRPSYQLRIDLQPERRLVTGAERVRFTPDLATDRLVFRLWPNGPRQLVLSAW